MEKLHKAGQITKTLLVFVLLIFIPFISSSMRTSYLYFLLNILILVLACESGLLQVGTDPNSSDHEKKRVATATAAASNPNPWTASLDARFQNNSNPSTAPISVGSFLLNKQPILVPAESPAAVVIDKAVVAAETMKKPAVAGLQKKQHHQKPMKKCPSVPSLFFIGSYDVDNDDEVVEEEYYYDPQEEHQPEEGEEEEMSASLATTDANGVLSKQELFSRAEMFIGNFYKQLKMQREESWNKLHGLYQKP